MKRILTAATLCLGALAVTPAMAAPKGCPPGLAKQNAACMPPGQYKRLDRSRYEGEREIRYRVGDRIVGDYVVIRDPSRWGLDPDYTYYRTGDEIFRVDRDTRRVLAFIGLASALLN